MESGRAEHSGNPIRVMIVDDSALMRKLLAQMLSRDPEIEVIDTAMDGLFALEHLARVRPDVVLLDVDMPRLDGLATLDRIVSEYGLPVVMCSVLSNEGASIRLESRARGAVDFIKKPSIEDLTNGTGAQAIAAQIHRAAKKNLTFTEKPSHIVAHGATTPRPLFTSEAPIWSGQSKSVAVERVAVLARRIAPELIALGTSTGGPAALEQVLRALPATFPLGILIVQHMPATFTKMLAANLDRYTEISVREAVEGDKVVPGVALIAPGNMHMRVRRTADAYHVTLDQQTATVNGHRPSVDVLFESVAIASRGRAAGVVMTGMGDDGTKGLGCLAEAGALTIAQSPDSCICHRMPKSAIDHGHVRVVVSLNELAHALQRCGTAASRSAS